MGLIVKIATILPRSSIQSGPLRTDFITFIVTQVDWDKKIWGKRMRPARLFMDTTDPVPIDWYV